MNHVQALRRADNPELYNQINLVQTMLCAVMNPSVHGAELERYALMGEPERRAARLRLEQELWRLIDQIPLPMAECFLEWINGLSIDLPGA